MLGYAEDMGDSMVKHIHALRLILSHILSSRNDSGEFCPRCPTSALIPWAFFVKLNFLKNTLKAFSAKDALLSFR